MNSSDIVIPFDFPFAILENRHNPDLNNKLVYAVADGQYTYGPLSLFQYHNDKKYAETIRTDELPPSLACREFYIVESGFSTDDAVEINDNNRGSIFVKELTETEQQETDDLSISVDQPAEKVQMDELFREMAECKSELRSLKSIVLSENRFKRRSTSTESPSCSRSENNEKWIRGGGGVVRSTTSGHMSDDGGVSTPLRYKKTSGIRKPQQAQSSIVQRSVSSSNGFSANKNVMTPLRNKTTVVSTVTSKYATPMRTTVMSTKKVVLKNIKSSGYGQFTASNDGPTTTTYKKQQQLATIATPGRSYRK